MKMNDLEKYVHYKISDKSKNLNIILEIFEFFYNE